MFSHCHHSLATLTRLDRLVPAAHHFKSLPGIFEGDTRFFCFVRFKTGDVVLYNYLCTGISVPCPFGDVERIGGGITKLVWAYGMCYNRRWQWITLWKLTRRSDIY